MKLSLEDKTKLTLLGERASDLLVKIMDEDNPKERLPTQNDLDLKKTLTNIYSICPLLSDSYVLMYNHIQRNKAGKTGDYMKILKPNTGYDSGYETEYEFKEA